MTASNCSRIGFLIQSKRPRRNSKQKLNRSLMPKVMLKLRPNRTPNRKLSLMPKPLSQSLKQKSQQQPEANVTEAKAEAKPETKPEVKSTPDTKAKTPTSDLTPQIAARAYELYERQGHRDGQSAQNWDKAEQEIRALKTKAETKPAAKAESAAGS